MDGPGALRWSPASCGSGISRPNSEFLWLAGPGNSRPAAGARDGDRGALAVAPLPRASVRLPGAPEPERARACHAASRLAPERAPDRATGLPQLRPPDVALPAHRGGDGAAHRPAGRCDHQPRHAPSHGSRRLPRHVDGEESLWRRTRRWTHRRAHPRLFCPMSSTLEDADVAVIGAGVIGLAVARAFALEDRDVVVLEADSGIGLHTSSRNSEVIHAGIYYPPGSLKAATCVQGRAALYAYCAEREIPHARVGKLIVATSAQEIPALTALRTSAEANGVHDLVMLSASEVNALEPEVSCAGGLFSPSTGIVDSHALMMALRRDAEARGAQIALSAPG